MTELLTLTESAARHIQVKIQEQPGAIALRLSLTQYGCSGLGYVTDIVTGPNEGDIEVNTPYGFKVYIDPKYLNELRGVLIDYVDKNFGQKQLIFINPNEAGSCGCGESFTVNEDPTNE